MTYYMVELCKWDEISFKRNYQKFDTQEAAQEAFGVLAKDLRLTMRIVMVTEEIVHDTTLKLHEGGDVQQQK